MFFEYTKEQTEFLAHRDKRLGEFIVRRGFVERTVFEDFFEGLCYNIVNQQLSMKACDTLWSKITAEFGKIVPEKLRCAERLKQCGLSTGKAECIERCAELFASGELSREKAEALSDKELIGELTRIKGIGEWTAEMTLIFCLSRQDILSLSDFGIRKGLSLLHGADVKDRRGMERFKALYSPYGTAASIYLWEFAANGQQFSKD